MKPTFFSLLPVTLFLLGAADARTDLEGCIPSATSNQWHEDSMTRYTSVNPSYTGSETVTATNEPSHLEEYKPRAAPTMPKTVQRSGAQPTAKGTAHEHEHGHYDPSVTTRPTDHGSITITSMAIPSAAASSVLEESARSKSSAVINSASTSSTPSSSSSLSPSPSPLGSPINPTGTNAGNAVGSVKFDVGLGALGLFAASVL